MPANAYVLLKVVPEKTQEVLARLREIPNAVVHEVLGPHDIVVELEADTNVDIRSIVSFKIRSIPHVTESVTCLWFEDTFHDAAG